MTDMNVVCVIDYVVVGVVYVVVGGVIDGGVVFFVVVVVVVIYVGAFCRMRFCCLSCLSRCD